MPQLVKDDATKGGEGDTKVEENLLLREERCPTLPACHDNQHRHQQECPVDIKVNAHNAGDLPAEHRDFPRKSASPLRFPVKYSRGAVERRGTNRSSENNNETKFPEE